MSTIDVTTAKDEEILDYARSHEWTKELESLVLSTGSERLLRLLLKHDISFSDKDERVFSVPGFISVYCELKPEYFAEMEDYILAEVVFPLCDYKAVKDVIRLKPKNLTAAIELLKEFSSDEYDPMSWKDIYHRVITACAEDS